MAAFDIFNPAKLPELLDNPSADELHVFMEYDNKQIENLSSQYQGTVDSIQNCLDEWSSYRQFLQESCKQLKHRDVINGLCINHSTAAIFSNISKLGKICRVVPINTADVERTFSQLKLIKTYTRNRMNEKTFDSL